MSRCCIWFENWRFCKNSTDFVSVLSIAAEVTARYHDLFSILRAAKTHLEKSPKYEHIHTEKVTKSGRLCKNAKNVSPVPGKIIHISQIDRVELGSRSCISNLPSLFQCFASSSDKFILGSAQAGADSSQQRGNKHIFKTKIIYSSFLSLIRLFLSSAAASLANRLKQLSEFSKHSGHLYIWRSWTRVQPKTTEVKRSRGVQKVTGWSEHF